MVCSGMTLALATCLLITVAQATPSEDAKALITNMLDEYWAQASARWKEQRAQWEVVLAKTNSVQVPSVGSVHATSIATQKANWALPRVNNTGPVKYVDLSRWPSELKSSANLKAALNFDASGANYPRVPKLDIPTPNMLTSCPLSSSVKGFGAAGDGSTDDSAAISTAASQLSFLYFPPGTYRISSSISVGKPMVFGQKATFLIDSGVVLTISKRPRWWNIGSTFGMNLFRGSGTVQLTGDCDWSIPDWFQAGSDDVAFQRAVDACKGSCTIIVNRGLTLSQAVYLKPAVGTFFTSASLLIAGNGNGNGIVLTPGKYKKPIYIAATIKDFNGFAVKIQGGVRGADIQLGGITNGVDGIVFAPDEGTPGFISNVFVTQLNAAVSGQNVVVIQSSTTKNRLRNCLVRANFVLGTGMRNIQAKSAGVVFRGRAPPTLVGTSVIFQNFEAGQDDNNPDSWSLLAWLRNATPNSAQKLVYRVEAWGGGISLRSKTLLAKGKFSNLKMLLRMGGWPDARHSWSIVGTKNYLTNGEVASAGATWTAPSIPDKSLFTWNGLASQLQMATVFYVIINVDGIWRFGESRSFYAWTAYARISTENTKARRDWVVFRAPNTGLIVSSIENQNSMEDGRIKITLLNVGIDIDSAWLPTHRFGIQML